MDSNSIFCLYPKIRYSRNIQKIGQSTHLLQNHVCYKAFVIEVSASKHHNMLFNLLYSIVEIHIQERPGRKNNGVVG